MVHPQAVGIGWNGTTWFEGAPLTKAWVRPLNGRDGYFMAEAGRDLDGAAFVSALLGRCVLALGEVDGSEVGDPTAAGGLGAAAVAALTVGDREALLMHLRVLSLGPHLDLVVDCTACGEPMDLAVDLTHLLAAVPPAVGRDHEHAGIGFRLPTGADQQAVAMQALDDPDGAAEALLARCLLDGPAPTPELAAEIVQAMARLDPLAEVTLGLDCPACGVRAAATLDGSGLLRRQLAIDESDLDSAVHLLALHYHWAEGEILDLPVARRRRYVSMLIDALSPAAF